MFVVVFFRIVPSKHLLKQAVQARAQRLLNEEGLLIAEFRASSSFLEADHAHETEST